MQGCFEVDRSISKRDQYLELLDHDLVHISLVCHYLRLDNIYLCYRCSVWTGFESKPFLFCDKLSTCLLIPIQF